MKGLCVCAVDEVRTCLKSESFFELNIYLYVTVFTKNPFVPVSVPLRQRGFMFYAQYGHSGKSMLSSSFDYYSKSILNLHSLEDEELLHILVSLCICTIIYVNEDLHSIRSFGSIDVT